MRRFYEIVCLERCDWETINNLDFLTLWKSISTEEDYLNGRGEELKVHQEELRQKDHVEHFALDMGISPGVEGEEEYRCTNVQIFQNYLNWAEEYRHTPMNEVAFGRALKARGFKAWRKSTSRGYWVKVEKRESTEGPSWNPYPIHKAPSWDQDPMSGNA
jgi:hypothetical protein